MLLAFQCSDETPVPEETITAADSLAVSTDTLCVDPVTQGGPAFAANAIRDLANYRPGVAPSANQLIRVSSYVGPELAATGGTVLYSLSELELAP